MEIKTTKFGIELLKSHIDIYLIENKSEVLFETFQGAEVFNKKELSQLITALLAMRDKMK